MKFLKLFLIFSMMLITISLFAQTADRDDTFYSKQSWSGKYNNSKGEWIYGEPKVAQIQIVFKNRYIFVRDQANSFYHLARTVETGKRNGIIVWTATDEKNRTCEIIFRKGDLPNTLYLSVVYYDYDLIFTYLIDKNL